MLPKPVLLSESKSIITCFCLKKKKGKQNKKQLMQIAVIEDLFGFMGAGGEAGEGL